MKTLPWLIAGIAALSYASAQADDLFREDGPGKSNRNLIIGNSYYEKVQIVGRLPGGKVEISAKGGRHIVDEKHLPPLWSAAMDKREAAKKAAEEARAKAAASPEEMQEEERQELFRKVTKLRQDADEVVTLMPRRFGKSTGGSVVGIILGFRKDRSEVLMSNGKEVAWVKMGYFTLESTQELYGIDVEAEEAAQRKAAEEKEEEERERKLTDVLRGIRERAAKEWPDDYSMQVYEIKQQREALSKILQWEKVHPFHFSPSEWEGVYRKARKEWPDNYSMQEYEIRQQGNALYKLKQQAE